MYHCTCKYIRIQCVHDEGEQNKRKDILRTQNRARFRERKFDGFYSLYCRDELNDVVCLCMVLMPIRCSAVTSKFLFGCESASIIIIIIITRFEHDGLGKKYETVIITWWMSLVWVNANWMFEMETFCHVPYQFIFSLSCWCVQLYMLHAL